MAKGISLEKLRDTVENGKEATNMIAFSRVKWGPLARSEISAIVDYIATWERLGEALALPAVLLTVTNRVDPAVYAALIPLTAPGIIGIAAHGAQLYATYCLACHGVKGEGRVSPRVARSWP